MGKYIRLIQFLKKKPKEFFLKVLLELIMVSMSFFQAYCLARGAAALLNKDTLAKVLSYLGMCLVTLLFRACLLRQQEGYVKKIAAKIKAMIRSTLLEKLMLLGPAYKNDRRTGNLQSLITDGVESLEPFLVQYLPQTIVVFITAVCATCYLWHLDSAVGWIVLLMTVLSIVIPHLFMPVVSKVMIEYWRDYADLNSQYIDSMQGMNTLKSLGVSKREGEKLSVRAWGFARESMNNLAVSLSDSAVIVACTAIGTVLSIAVAACHMAQGQIPYESLLLILFLVRETMKPINDMNRYWHSSYLGLSVAEELFAVLDERVKLTDGNLCSNLEGKLPGISIQEVSFRYEEEAQDVLQKINMELEAGKVTAIVGKSGSGKSTIVNLLQRFYDVSSGKILLDGRNIKEYQLDYLRNHIAVVFQESYLFYGTVKENLLMANPGASDEEIVHAAKMANAHAFIMKLPEGYDTLVGERGATLSGGERQRISIARAILKNAPILILDEATSSVDMKHEALIQEALNRCMENRTTIIIAHRLSTVEHADKIYVLKQGRVAGMGTHQELMENNKIYQGLVKAQEYAK